MKKMQPFNSNSAFFSTEGHDKNLRPKAEGRQILIWNTEQGFSSKVAKTWKHCQGKLGTCVSLCLQIIVNTFLEEIIECNKVIWYLKEKYMIYGRSVWTNW